MPTHHAETLGTAAGLVALALGCISTGDGLFRDEGEVGAPAVPVDMSPASESLPVAPAPVVTPAPPEQRLGGALDAPPIAPTESEEADQMPDAAALAPVSPPPAAMATDPCAFEGPILCDTFEDATDAVFPTGGGWLPELTGCGSHRVDAAGPSFSGTHALRADAGGYPECMLHAQLLGENDVYVRTRVFIGDTAGALAQYVSLLEFGSRAAQDDPELRIGLRPVLDNVCPGAPGVDVSANGLAGGSTTECTGFALEPGRWYCVEAHFARAGANLTLNVSVDGAELVARDFASTPAWASDQLYLKLGRAAYGASSLGSVWHDDVAVGRQPIPCGP